MNGPNVPIITNVWIINVFHFSVNLQRNAFLPINAQNSGVLNNDYENLSFFINKQLYKYYKILINVILFSI